MNAFKDVSVIIPVTNESSSLVATVQIIGEECNKEDIAEIVVVTCQRTTPRSLSAVSRLSALANLRVTPLRQTVPGLTAAITQGVNAAVGSHIIIMAADLDTDPHLVSAFVEQAKKHPDCVISASRWLPSSDMKGYGKGKTVVNYAAQRILSVLFRNAISDYTYGYKLVPGEAFKSIKLSHKGSTAGFESTVKLLLSGVRFIEIPAVWNKRREGHSNFSLARYLDYISVLLEAALSLQKGKRKSKVIDSEETTNESTTD